MPRLATNADVPVKVPSGGLAFSTVSFDTLKATEYTIVTLVVDVSGSVSPFKDDLEDCLQEVISALRKDARSENLIFRLMLFNSNIIEHHGFVELPTINEGDYKNIINPSGSTSLYDAVYASIEATMVQGENMMKSDYDANGIAIFLTDGMENTSTIHNDARDIKDLIQQVIQKEVLESFKTILIGVGNDSVKAYLADFKDQAGIDEFIHIGEATASKLAKLAGFISQSISSQSQALGSGGVSQPINPQSYGF